MKNTLKEFSIAIGVLLYCLLFGAVMIYYYLQP